MKCLSKTRAKQIRQKAYEDYLNAREEMFSKMTPEERQKYEKISRDRAIKALASMQILKNQIKDFY